jgi:hypothetical protein
MRISPAHLGSGIFANWFRCVRPGIKQAGATSDAKKSGL